MRTLFIGYVSTLPAHLFPNGWLERTLRSSPTAGGAVFWKTYQVNSLGVVYMDDGHAQPAELRISRARWRTSPSRVLAWCFVLMGISVFGFLCFIAFMSLRPPGWARNDIWAVDRGRGFGIIKERLRHVYVQNGNKIDQSWTVAAVVGDASWDLKYHSVGDYRFGAPLTDNQAVIELWTSFDEGPSLTLTMTITDISTGAFKITR